MFFLLIFLQDRLMVLLQWNEESQIKGEAAKWHVFASEFYNISKNTLFTEQLWMAASDFFCGVFFIFSIIKKKVVLCKKVK